MALWLTFGPVPLDATLVGVAPRPLRAGLGGGGGGGRGAVGGRRLRRALRRAAATPTTRAWDAALLRARRPALPSLPVRAGPRGERLLGQARLMVAGKSRRLLEQRTPGGPAEARRLRELGTALTTACDV